MSEDAVAQFSREQQELINSNREKAARSFIEELPDGPDELVSALRSIWSDGYRTAITIFTNLDKFEAQKRANTERLIKQVREEARDERTD